MTAGETGPRAPLRFVALGDSYTIGTAVAESDRWPNQLVSRVAALVGLAASARPPRPLDLVANLGGDGFTSRDVVERELPQLDGLRPGLVTLLVGVNDVVQGVPEATYRRNVALILDEVAQLVGPDRVVVVTTPDYTVTPSGAAFGDPAQQATGIRTNDAIITEAATARGIAVVDIHDISLRAGTDRSLVASDGLHPSGAQYALWVERIVPSVASMLGR